MCGCASASTSPSHDRRLEQSGLFESVELRTRYRSLTDAQQVAVVVLLTERALVSASDTGDVVMPGALARLRRNTMFLPILAYEDGYGLTYGVRLTVVGSRQSATRVSAPLSGGGTRQAALEASRKPATRDRRRPGLLATPVVVVDDGPDQCPPVPGRRCPVAGSR